MTVTRKLSPAISDRLRVLWLQGCPASVIAERLGITRTTVYKHAKRFLERKEASG